MAFALTRRQRDCLDFVRGYIAANGQGPTLEEIAAGIGMRSKSGAHRLLNSLIERGHIRRLDKCWRALEVVDDGRASPPVRRERPAGFPVVGSVEVVFTPEGTCKGVRICGNVVVTQVIE